jgi:hypothetical protein
MHNTDPWSGSTLTGAGMAGDQPCATTGTIHGRGSDELMTSRCVQGGLRIGGAQAATLHFLFNVGRPWGPGSRPVGLGSQSIVCRGIQNRGCMRVGPRRFCLELDREWGLESCVALVGVSWELGHTRVTQATGCTASRHGTKGARGAVEGCGL